MTDLVDRASVFAVGLTAALTGFVLLRPTGVIGGWIAQERHARAEKAAIASNWADLLKQGQPIGNLHGRNVLVEFADYQCPFCRRSHDAVHAWLKQDTTAVLYYLHYPIEGHPLAVPAAKAAICAGEQQVFPAMHDRLMETDAWQSDSNWVREATAAGVSDLKAFELCLASPSTAEKIEEGKRLGAALQITGTPAFVSKGTVHTGQVTLTELTALP